MVLDLLHRLVTSFYTERVNIYTLKNAIEIPFLGTCSNEKCFYTLGVPISRPLYFNLIRFFKNLNYKFFWFETIFIPRKFIFNFLLLDILTFS